MTEGVVNNKRFPLSMLNNLLNSIPGHIGVSLIEQGTTLVLILHIRKENTTSDITVFAYH